MLFLLQIISGWPGLFIVALLWMLVQQMPAVSRHPARSSNCRLFNKQRNPLYLKSFNRILKRPFSIPSLGTRLSFLSNRPGLSPEIKSSRPGFFAFLPGSVKRAGFLMGILIVSIVQIWPNRVYLLHYFIALGFPGLVFNLKTQSL